jgi:hypothetical protein
MWSHLILPGLSAGKLVLSKVKRLVYFMAKYMTMKYLSKAVK